MVEQSQKIIITQRVWQLLAAIGFVVMKIIMASIF